MQQLEQIVLIDDDSFDNKYHTKVIERTGLVKNIRSFNMAEDALDYFREKGPDVADLVFLDINMPRMDGFELLEQARAEFGTRFEKFVVIMLTTSLDPTDRARAENFPVVRDYVQKSLSKDVFVHLVEGLSRDRQCLAG